jgi:hypothetical protein
VESELISRPTVAELSFQLYDRSVHPELIERLVSRGFERDGYSLRLDLTPAGHLFEWRWKKVILVELLANQSQPLPENRQLFTHRGSSVLPLSGRASPRRRARRHPAPVAAERPHGTVAAQLP